MNIETKKLGKLAPKKDSRLLHLANFADTQKEAPKESFFWKKKAAFPQRSFGNTIYGDCTRASQALAAMRMERIETRRTINITDEEVVRVYLEMTAELYGGGDTGAYEMDALNFWRREDKTFRDTKGRPYTIDAYTAVNFRNINEVKNAIALSGAHGIKVCVNLPYAYAMQQGLNWDVPDGQSLTGIWQPGSWGGHSIFCSQYNEKGIYWPTTWNTPDGFISWKAFAAYADECYLIVDSVNKWKKKKAPIDLDALKKAVNEVSSVPVK